jgi:hypothetical protein
MRLMESMSRMTRAVSVSLESSNRHAAAGGRFDLRGQSAR